MAKSRIVVVGSSNIDMVVKCETIPRAGETVLGGEFVMVPGGKGANQAVCAAKLGADVALVARVGGDVFGEKSLANFRSVGIDTRFVTRDESVPSGVALIVVDADGENAIVVAPGANHTLMPSHVDAARDLIAGADAVILQLEIPVETVLHTIEVAAAVGTRVVLNPAPMRPIPPEVLSKVDLLVPNEHEAAGLIGVTDGDVQPAPADVAASLLALGVKAVVITLGSRGACVATGGTSEMIPAVRVDAVDTTAAGDAFTASLAVAAAEGLDLTHAAGFAARVSAIVVTRMGAQTSMPSRQEVDSFQLGTGDTPDA